MTKAFRASVSGRVQMVMYRDFAQRKARGLDIVGTVKNLPDGTVEVYAEGDESALLRYLQKLHKGSLLSRVDRVEEHWIQPTGTFNDFSILF